jgi:SAM-dependent MidA family methyltransferase
LNFKRTVKESVSSTTVVNLSGKTDSCTADFYGPLTQCDYLHRMGITARLEALLQRAPVERRKDLVASYRRLVDKVGMGHVYKVMAMTPLGTGKPTAFE